MGDEMDKFIGRWQVCSTENMDEMLRAFDMEESRRRLYADMSFIMEYVREGPDRCTYNVLLPSGATKTYTYSIGQEYESETLDGRPILSKVEVLDGKFVEVHRDKADPTLDAQMIREVTDDQLIVTAKVRNITSITRHKRL